MCTQPAIHPARLAGTRVAEGVEAEGAVALVSGEVEELKVTVGLRGEGQIELDTAILVHLGLWGLVLPVHPEPAGRDTTARGPAPSEGGDGQMPSCHPLPSGFPEGGGTRGSGGWRRGSALPGPRERTFTKGLGGDKGTCSGSWDKNSRLLNSEFRCPQ